MKVKTSLVVNVPPERVYDIYADYAGWPRVFPTISAVRLVKRTGKSVVLEVEHRTAGKVRNELRLQPKASSSCWKISSVTTPDSSTGSSRSAKARGSP